MEQSKVPYSEVNRGPNDMDLQHPQDGPFDSNRTRNFLTRRWSRGMKMRLPAFGILIMAVVPVVLLATTDSGFLTKSTIDLLLDENMPCDVDAPWTSWGSLFQINARSGVISFASAKGIDIAYDLVVGQGLRLCLALLAWRVYGEAVIRIMEENAVPYELLASVAVSGTFDTILGIYKTLRRTKSRRARSIVVWMFLSIAYLVFFPTLISAGTSYVAVSQKAVRLINNSTALWQEYVNDTASVAYDFHNGSTPWIVNLQYYEAGPGVPCGQCLIHL